MKKTGNFFNEILKKYDPTEKYSIKLKEKMMKKKMMKFDYFFSNENLFYDRKKFRHLFLKF